ncbi:MAG: hypothetical protein DRJ10_02470 [Bacteroidetes bacterium]|nr:MAG: hypothetical protein DRJ10_02470 [Bacteroidota bacterium]
MVFYTKYLHESSAHQGSIAADFSLPNLVAFSVLKKLNEYLLGNYKTASTNNGSRKISVMGSNSRTK